MKKINILVIAILFATNIFAQNVGINEDGSNPDESAILDVKSTTKGVLVPRMTVTQRIAISSPAEGLMVYQTDDVKGFYYYDGSTWELIGQKFGNPVGTVISYMGTTIPDGWLLCDGSQINRTTYAGLFTAIGTSVGSGDGSTTFHLPDLRGRFLRGVDGTAGNDPDNATRTAMNAGGNVGNLVGSVQDNSTVMPINSFTTNGAGSHTHDAGSLGGSTNTTGNHYHLQGNEVNTAGVRYGTSAAANAGTVGATHERTNAANTSTTGNHAHTLTITGITASDGTHAHTISGGDTETRPVNAYVNYIIKY